ncbi:MAG TPA: hypothetical protein VH877_34160 [Polyangia bacterium]|jgi:hypothetical protein|nr:hypothetical protein [Polyangia bacterium]
MAKKLVINQSAIQTLVDSNKTRMVGEAVCMDHPGNPGITSGKNTLKAAGR